jgi:glycolate dehydrogenase FAD-binding subunit
VDPQTCTIDGFGPLPMVRPQTVAELGDVVRRATAEGQAVYPVGGQTALGIGLAPSRRGVAVDLRGLADVIDYPARDMTITVGAGITLDHLQQLLAGENQRLPVDVPHGDRATLGGALAVNASGPRRLGFGTLRDYVIGISTINDEGIETKAGGRVVKNVAGYDLCKLHVGALGTLGIISQVTLKVRPLPEARALLTLGCEASALDALLAAIHNSRIRPACVEAINRPAARALGRAGGALPDTPWVLVLGFEDSDAAVNWQVQQFLREAPAPSVSGLEVRAGAASEPLGRALVEFTSQPAAVAAFKANLLPSAVASFALQAAALADDLQIQAHAGSGIVRGHFTGPLTLERATPMLKELLAASTAAQGNLVVVQCPPDWKRSLPVWGMPRNDEWLMRQVKAKLDPRSVFNPGRFVGGI